MNVKQAVAIAKAHVADLFADESIANLGLEEVKFDEHGDVWQITIGFARPWDMRLVPGIAPGITGSEPGRTYKIVYISEIDGKVLQVAHREMFHS